MEHAKRNDNLQNLVQPVPPYEPPLVQSYSDETLFDLLGPAQALYGCDPTNPVCGSP